MSCFKELKTLLTPTTTTYLEILSVSLSVCLSVSSPDAGGVLVTDDVLEPSCLLDPPTVTNLPTGSGKYLMTISDRKASRSHSLDPGDTRNKIDLLSLLVFSISVQYRIL